MDNPTINQKKELKEYFDIQKFYDPVEEKFAKEQNFNFDDESREREIYDYYIHKIDQFLKEFKPILDMKKYGDK